ncbi:MAG: M48 family metalloprotease [Proteobacteria bacterium]|nr:M48 family metalloprotease [Pseudomonadota bacterium]
MKKIINMGIFALAWCLFFCGPIHSETNRTRISATGDNFSETADIEAEILFGRDLAARILGNYKAVTDKALITYVNTLGKGLGLYSGRPELEFRFIVLDSNEINAFATPGGYIFITRGAIGRMDNEAQLACVLAHEIAHITKKHVVRKLNIRGDESSSFAMLTGAIGSNTAAFRNLLETTLNEAADILFEKGYKLKEEMEADSVGLQIAALAGYAPMELKTFLIACKGFEKKDASYKGEHPQLTVRLKSINQTLLENGLDKQTKAKVRRRFHAYAKK